jgi:type I restriction enzyme, S subunit
MRDSPLSVLATIHYGKSPSEVLSIDGSVPIVGTGGIYGKAREAMFPEGVVVARKGSLGTPHLMASPFWPVDTTYAVIPRKEVDLKWLYYSLANFDLEKLNEATGVPSINRDWLSRIVFLNPGFERQQKIAAILTSIDTAIEKTEALIEKYQQIKAGLMHDLFTRGVLPNGQLRPPRDQAPELYQETAIGWIPKEWNLTTCAKVCEKIIDCKNRTPPEAPDGFPVIRTPNVRNGEFVDDELLHTDEHSYQVWTMRGRPQVGDIVITREAPVGEVCAIPSRHPLACLSQRMMLYRPNHEVIDSSYFLYALQSRHVQNRLDLISGGSTVGHVRVGDIRDLWLLMPESRAEQAHIAFRLDSISNNLNVEKQHLNKLRNQRLGLMQDLLTGKVPVRVDTPSAEHAHA